MLGPESPDGEDNGNGIDNEAQMLQRINSNDSDKLGDVEAELQDVATTLDSQSFMAKLSNGLQQWCKKMLLRPRSSKYKKIGKPSQ